MTMGRTGFVIAAIFVILSLHHACCQKVGWCVISDLEAQKCWKMVDALKAEGVTPELQCILGANAQECMELISNGDAHLITLDGGDVFHAGVLYGMQPVMGEEYDYGKYYYAVAVIRRANSDLTFRKLKGRKSCHTGVRKTSGWNVPIGYLISSGAMEVNGCQGDIKAAGAFFSQSCAPGALNRDYNPDSDNPTNLCDLCVGQGGDYCARSGHEPYYNYQGAFRCLVENAGDVAFVKHTTVQDALDSAPTWAEGEAKANFLLMCRDGSTASVDDYERCNLARVVGHAVMTSRSATVSDIASYQQLLNTAQQKFGSDAGDGFKMFDSSDYSSGKDLMFKDATRRLYSVSALQTYVDYLGEDYVKTVQGLSECPSDTLRWCVVGPHEREKCQDMKQAVASAGISKTLSCYSARDHAECMSLIKSRFADIVTLDGGDVFTAGRDFGLKPVAGETYSEDMSSTSYYSVAVVKKASRFSIKELKGKKSCHTGIQKTSGWVIPVGYLAESKQIAANKPCDIAKEVGSFFDGSCVPGARSSRYDPQGLNPESLCSLCVGSDNDKCARNSKEPFYDYAGAFRCLAAGPGDVAFVKHTTVRDNTDGNNLQVSWARTLKSDDYQLLCRDGSRAAVSDWKTCNLAVVPSHAVMMRGDADSNAAWTFLSEAQFHFGKDKSEEFKMFDSSKYRSSNLMFKDSTVQLVAAGSKNTYEKWLGSEYVKALRATQCTRRPTNGVGRTAASGLGGVTLILALLLTCLLHP